MQQMNNPYNKKCGDDQIKVRSFPHFPILLLLFYLGKPLQMNTLQ